MYQNGLIKKIRLIPNFMTSEPGSQTIVINILPNISRSKDNQTMKFGQLIEFNTRNNFFEKSYTKCGGETSPRHFSDKIKIDHISGYLRNLVSVLTKFGKRQTSVSTSTKDQSLISAKS